MTDVVRSSDCGNSPKNKLAEDIAIAMEVADVAFLTPFFDASTAWRRPDGERIGAAAIIETLRTAKPPSRVEVEHALSHGRVGAVSGSRKVGRAEERFCHVIEFSSVKCTGIRKIDSYRDST